MDKKLQDLAWSVLPKEFKEDVRMQYQIVIYDSQRCALEYLFGKHNLTSDAEGEEMLTVPRKKVQEIYSDNCVEIHRECVSSSDKDCYEYANEVFKTLFGSKCLPDENSSNIERLEKDDEPKPAEEDDPDLAQRLAFLNSLSDEHSKPKPAEPKFKVGDKVKDISSPHDGGIYKVDDIKKSSDGFIYHIQGLIGKSNVKESDLGLYYTEPRYHIGQKVKFKDKDFGFEITAIEKWDDCDEYKYKLAGWKRSYRESDLEPYTEPKEESRNLSQETVNCDKSVDNDLKDTFVKERRLNIAAMITQGIMANPSPQMIAMDVHRVADLAILMADTLIAEAEEDSDGKLTSIK